MGKEGGIYLSFYVLFLVLGILGPVLLVMVIMSLLTRVRRDEAQVERLAPLGHQPKPYTWTKTADQTLENLHP